MNDWFAGLQPWHMWFKGILGRFGWLDYGSPHGPTLSRS